MFSNDTSCNDSWAWFLILILALFGGFGGNAFGGGYNRGVAVADSATKDAVYTVTNAQSNADRLSEIIQGIGNVNYNMANQTNALQQGMNAGFNSVNSSISDLSHQMATCCCDIKTALLQDKYDNVRYQLEQANTAIANAAQTQNLLNTMGFWSSKPAVNPYGCYNNGYQFGTTIA